MDWIGAAKFGLGQLAYLSGGSASVIGQTYSVIGIAATSQSFEAISGELQKTLPASLALGEARVTPPFASPYRFTAEMSPGGLKLSGVAPDDTTRQTLREAAAERFEQPITDEIELGSGAPDGFAAVATAALQAVSRLEGGTADIADRAVTLRGTAPFAGAAERIKAQLEAALPEGFVLNANLALSSPQTRVTPAECQTLLGQELAKGGIQFGKGEADIAPESEGLLDRLAALVDRCPEAKIEIGGHTDSGGSTRRNRDLSQARADAVMRYLVDAGIAEERLTAVGYGETKPIASNDTEEGRAQNRRIEFTVQEP
jgi:OOP family OmpA-OmpF porin